MKHIMIFLIISGFLLPGILDSNALLIDPFVTHTDVNQTIAPQETVFVDMQKTEHGKRLGFQLFQLGDDALKVTVIDPNGSITPVSITYHVDESYGENGRVNISTEFKPEFSGIYKIKLQNTSNLPVVVNGYHGIMMSLDEIQEIQKEYGYGLKSNTFVDEFLITGLIGVGLGSGGCYAFFRLRKK